MKMQSKMETLKGLATFMAKTNWNEEAPKLLSYWTFLSEEATEDELKKIIQWTPSIWDALYEGGQQALTEYHIELTSTL